MLGLVVNAVLLAYITRINAGDSHQQAVVAAAEACANDPWLVVTAAGLLARCRVEVAQEPIGLTADLRCVAANAKNDIVRVEQGQCFPVIDRKRRRQFGAFDTGPRMAKDLVHAALARYDGRVNSGLDPACGAGAFLLAMAEAGVEDVRGEDQDELVLAIAQIAVPRARLQRGDALKSGSTVDLVVGNPPFVPPERQSRAVREQARTRFPWLSGRFDLVVPFAASAVERCKPGGLTALVLPSAMLTQPYGAPLRREWLQRHNVLELSPPTSFKGASVFVSTIILRAHERGDEWPAGELRSDDLLALPNAPFHTMVSRHDLALVRRIRERSCALGDHCLVDTGVVAHSPGGSKHDLLRSTPDKNCVPYADARAFFAGEHVWLDYQPDRMHRAKHPSMFEEPKIVIQRLRGKRRVRAKVDRTGIYVGHTCTVVQPLSAGAPRIDRLVDLVSSPIVDAVTRIERGARLDLYPKDVAAFPLPRCWLTDDSVPIAQAFGLTPGEVARLEEITTQL